MTESCLRTNPSTWSWDKYCKMILDTAVNGDPRLVYNNCFQNHEQNDHRDPDGIRVLLTSLKKYAVITNLFNDVNDKLSERVVIMKFLDLIRQPDVGQFFRTELARGNIYNYARLDEVLALYSNSQGYRNASVSQISSHFVPPGTASFGRIEDQGLYHVARGEPTSE